MDSDEAGSTRADDGRPLKPPKAQQLTSFAERLNRKGIHGPRRFSAHIARPFQQRSGGIAEHRSGDCQEAHLWR